MPFAYPRRHRRLPQLPDTITDNISLCYANKILDEPAFDLPRAKDTREHMVCKLFLAEKTYLFGRYTGKDGQRHVGFDVAEGKDEDGRLDDAVEWIPPAEKTRRRHNRMANDEA